MSPVPAARRVRPRSAGSSPATATVTRVRRLHPPFVIALVLWTFFVWTTRLRNIWTDDALATGEQWASTALAGSFTVLAVVALVALVRRAAWLRGAVGALGAWSVAVWAVRSVAIATAGHEVGFVVVHLVLAVVSVLLAGLAWREVDEARPGSAPA